MWIVDIAVLFLLPRKDDGKRNEDFMFFGAIHVAAVLNSELNFWVGCYQIVLLSIMTYMILDMGLRFTLQDARSVINDELSVFFQTSRAERIILSLTRGPYTVVPEIRLHRDRSCVAQSTLYGCQSNVSHHFLLRFE